MLDERDEHEARREQRTGQQQRPPEVEVETDGDAGQRLRDDRTELQPEECGEEQQGPASARTPRSSGELEDDECPSDGDRRDHVREEWTGSDPQLRATCARCDGEGGQTEGPVGEEHEERDTEERAPDGQRERCARHT